MMKIWPPHAYPESPSFSLPSIWYQVLALARVRNGWKLLRVSCLPLFQCPLLSSDWPGLWTAPSWPTICMWTWAFEKLHGFDLLVLLTSDFLIHPLFNPTPSLILSVAPALWVWVSRCGKVPRTMKVPKNTVDYWNLIPHWAPQHFSICVPQSL